MKSRTISFLLLIITISFVSAGCNKWLDVKPGTLVAPNDLFATEGGFEDAMIGVYTVMARPAVYGDQLTMSFLDVLAQQYSCQNNTDHQFYQASIYNYQDGPTKTRIEAIWDSMYVAIVNVNNLLLNIDAHKAIFQPGNYSLIKGEALGARAFLHFDLLRLFGASWRSNAAMRAIPYVTTVSGNVTRLLTVNEVLDTVIAELTTASTLLKSYTDINYNYAAADNQKSNTWLNNRQQHFNYWAAEATLARAYLYKNDQQQALQHAQRVIDSRLFDFQTPDRITNYQDRTYIPEHIFSLSKFDLSEQANTYFMTSGTVINTSVNYQLTNTYGNNGVVDQIYETGSGGVSDIRYARGWEPSGTIYFCSKFWQTANPPYRNLVPLIRLPEMYYIAAECSDPATAVGYLNTVRRNRGLADLSTTLDAETVRSEIAKEYQKEFYEEGQLFYYYKRTNSSQIRFTAVPGSDRLYVLPLPDSEQQYR